MNIDVTPATVEEIAPLRDLHRHEMHCQIMHDSFLRRGFSDPYFIRVNDRVAGYGLVAKTHWPETVNEFHVFPAYRASSLPMFRRLLEVSRATKILAQTNDRLQMLMLYDCAESITSEIILFEDAVTTYLTCPDVFFRRVGEADKDRVFEHKVEPVGEWMIEHDGTPVATGGALFHYNPPYGDIHMEVDPAHRRRGYGSFLVQEIKRVTYEMGKIPAARCDAGNEASRRTLEKAGLLPCGRVLVGEVSL